MENYSCSQLQFQMQAIKNWSPGHHRPELDSRIFCSGIAKTGYMPGQSTMFIPLMSRDLTQSMRECQLVLLDSLELEYSRCPANTNDLATPLLFLAVCMKLLALLSKFTSLFICHVQQSESLVTTIYACCLQMIITGLH